MDAQEQQNRSEALNNATANKQKEDTAKEILAAAAEYFAFLQGPA